MVGGIAQLAWMWTPCSIGYLKFCILLAGTPPQMQNFVQFTLCIPLQCFQIFRNFKHSPTLEILMADKILGFHILYESRLFKLIREGSYTPWHYRVNTILNKALSLWWMCSRHAKVYGDCQPGKCATPAYNGIWCVIWWGERRFEEPSLADAQ